MEAYPIQGGGMWMLEPALLAELESLFPAVRVTDECRYAKAWLLAHPERLKTARGMRRFLTRWLTRASQNQQQPMPTFKPQLRMATPPPDGAWRSRCASLGHRPPCQTPTACWLIRERSQPRLVRVAR